MKIQFIGTGSGRTSLKRFHSSFIIKFDDSMLLVDAGDGISRALLKQNINFSDITEIIVTHHHSDHFAGLPSLLTQMILNKRDKPLNIYSEKSLSDSLIKFLNMSYIFLDKLNFRTEIIGLNLNEPLELSGLFKVVARQNSHVTNKYNIIDPTLVFVSSSLFFIINGKSLLYTSDLGSGDEINLFNDFKIDMLISETTHIELTTLENFRLSHPDTRIILTHIDDIHESILKEWINRLNPKIQNAFQIATDGLILDF